MDSYIVRIYRRDPKDSKHVVGMVEAVERGSRKSFTDMQGLWDILVSIAPAAARRRNRKIDSRK